jgi:hypothetical protein
VSRWKRTEFREWLGTILRHGEPKALVALNFGLGLPWGTDREVFGCAGWRATVRAIAKLYAQYQTARAVAQFVSGQPRFAGHGPFRFNENRTDFRFYLQHGVAYYRLVETTIPQAISQWYLGAGGTVGFHTITGLAAIHQLMAQREAGQINFRVWPQECEHPTDIGDAHVLVESYTAVYPKPASFGPCTTADQCDAWKVLSWMQGADEQRLLAESFSPSRQRFGRVEGINFWDQVRFEGWILVVR